MDFIAAFVCIIKALWNWFIGSLVALLPCGILPRKSTKGKVVLITGSGGGLGRILAQKFGELGSTLVLWDIAEKSNLETKILLEAAGVKTYLYTVDLSNREHIYETADRVKKDVGDIDILINNAGIVSGKKLFDCPDDLMEKTLAVNTSALFFMAKAFVPGMIKKCSGHVVTISSLAGLHGVSGLVDYCASKFGAIGFNEALRAEFDLQGYKDLHVTTVCPFYMDTGMFRGVISYCPLLFPILEVEFVADRIMEAVLTNATEVLIPRTAYLFLAVKSLLPTKAASIIVNYFKLNQSMETFVGHSK